MRKTPPLTPRNPLALAFSHLFANKTRRQHSEPTAKIMPNNLEGWMQRRWRISHRKGSGCDRDWIACLC